MPTKKFMKPSSSTKLTSQTLSIKSNITPAIRKTYDGSQRRTRENFMIKEAMSNSKQPEIVLFLSFSVSADCIKPAGELQKVFSTKLS